MLQNNVVVVGQPAVASTVRVELPPKASDFLIFSVVLMVLCFIHGNIPFVLLTIPALICSIVVSMSLIEYHAFNLATGNIHSLCRALIYSVSICTNYHYVVLYYLHLLYYRPMTTTTVAIMTLLNSVGIWLLVATLQ